MSLNKLSKRCMRRVTPPLANAETNRPSPAPAVQLPPPLRVALPETSGVQVPSRPPLDSAWGGCTWYAHHVILDAASKSTHNVHGVILLIVAESPIPNQIDDDRLSRALYGRTPSVQCEIQARTSLWQSAQVIPVAIHRRVSPQPQLR